MVLPARITAPCPPPGHRHAIPPPGPAGRTARAPATGSPTSPPGPSRTPGCGPPTLWALAQRHRSPSTSTTRSIAPGSSGFGWRASAPSHRRATRTSSSAAATGPFSFLLLGDPGEGDNSQYAVVPPLLVEVRGHGLHGHLQRRDLPRGRAGRLPHEVLPPLPRPRLPDLRRARQPRLVRRAARLHVEPVRDRRAAGAAEGRPRRPRRGSRSSCGGGRTGPSDDDIATMRADRSRQTQVCEPAQPGPYWAIDAGPVRIVGIDTGIVGTLDADQAAWLRRVSLGSDRPKILITGKPLIVNGAAGSPSSGASDIAEVVADPRRQLRGGDRRRHAQLPALPGQARRAHDPVRGQRRRRRVHARDAPDPARRRSMATRTNSSAIRCAATRWRASRSSTTRKFAGGKGWLVLCSAEAATYLSELLQLTPTREQPVPLSRRARIAAKLLQPAPSAQRVPPLRLGVLRLERPAVLQAVPARRRRPTDELTVRCFGVTGCRDASADAAGRGLLQRALLSQRAKRATRRRPARGPSRRRVRAASQARRACVQRSCRPPSIRASSDRGRAGGGAARDASVEAQPRSTPRLDRGSAPRGRDGGRPARVGGVAHDGPLRLALEARPGRRPPTSAAAEASPPLALAEGDAGHGVRASASAAASGHDAIGMALSR